MEVEIGMSPPPPISHIFSCFCLGRVPHFHHHHHLYPMSEAQRYPKQKYKWSDIQTENHKSFVFLHFETESFCSNKNLTKNAATTGSSMVVTLNKMTGEIWIHIYGQSK